MNKADLIDRIAASCHISKTQAATAIDTTVDSITSALKKGDRVALIGFGTFSVSQRKARNGRNPQRAPQSRSQPGKSPSSLPEPKSRKRLTEVSRPR